MIKQIFDEIDIRHEQLKKIKQTYSNIIVIVDNFIELLDIYERKRTEIKILEIKQLTLGLSHNEKQRFENMKDNFN